MATTSEHKWTFFNWFLRRSNCGPTKCPRSSFSSCLAILVAASAFSSFSCKIDQNSFGFGGFHADWLLASKRPFLSGFRLKSLKKTQLEHKTIKYTNSKMKYVIWISTCNGPASNLTNLRGWLDSTGVASQSCLQVCQCPPFPHSAS